MPTFSRASHISFSVRDAETSARWSAALLELTELDRVAGDGSHGILLRHPSSRTIIEFQQHDGNQGETFDPRRTGFDHMSFNVDARADLDEWLARFEQLGATHSPIVGRGYGAVLTFKDPDGIQFEIFKADHPQQLAGGLFVAAGQSSSAAPLSPRCVLSEGVGGKARITSGAITHRWLHRPGYAARAQTTIALLSLTRRRGPDWPQESTATRPPRPAEESAVEQVPVWRNGRHALPPLRRGDVRANDPAVVCNLSVTKPPDRVV